MLCNKMLTLILVFETVRLDYNQIVFLPTEIGLITGLQDLYLSKCVVDEIVFDAKSVLLRIRFMHCHQPCKNMLTTMLVLRNCAFRLQSNHIYTNRDWAHVELANSLFE